MTPEEARDFQEGVDRYKEGPPLPPTVVEEAEQVLYEDRQETK